MLTPTPNSALPSPGGALPPTLQAAAAQRRALLVQALPVLESGGSQTDVVAATGCSHAQISRLLARVAQGTPLDRCRALLAAPLDALVDIPNHDHTRSDFEALLHDEKITLELQELYLATLRASSEVMSHGRHTGSMSLALKRLADHASVPEWARERLRAGATPAPLVRFLRRITPELEQLVRGDRKFRLHGPHGQTDNTLRLPDGRRARMLAGHRVVMDDMSVNQPFYAELREDGRVVETILSRQGLYAMDEATWRWLGVELIARPREAYRAEDILRFVHRLMSEHGKFDVLVLEQGIWRARSIAGFKPAASPSSSSSSSSSSLVPDAIEDDFLQRPDMDPEEQANLAAGLEGIGVRIEYVTSARGKTIEGAFNHLQPVLATFTRDFQNIGAHAGEFERAAKQLRRVRAGSHHPETLCFAPQMELRDRIVQAMQWINEQPRACARGLSSDAAWADDMQLRTLPRLADYEAAVFLPETRARELRGGGIHFDASLTGYKFSFRNGELFAALGDGYKLLVKFDPSNPAGGAAILNNEAPSNPRNWNRARPGQFLGWAEFELCGPREEVNELPAGHVAVADYYGLGNAVSTDIGDQELRRQKRAFRSEAAVLSRPGQPTIKTSTARDGRGNAVEVGRGKSAEGREPLSPIPSTRSATARQPARRLAAVATQDSYAAMFGG